MASMILSTAGNAAFGPIGGFLGALAGNAIDAAAITALSPARVQPSRLAGLRVQASQEGAPIPIIYGRFRVTGQVIWASKFNEISTKRTVGGKGGQRVVERSYTISFAIGLAEGPISGIGKVWANGNLIDLSTLSHRLYLGTETQMPDPLIEALEGLGNAPAFRGLGYIVFEDMALGAFNDRIPQMSFEVMAQPAATAQGAPRLTDLARGVCLIPGAGEFAYATTPIRKLRGPGDELGENIHAQAGRADFEVAIDQLQRDFPKVEAVSLVVAWFGNDLRAGMCTITPKVEDSTKQTSPRAWSVAGLTRATAGLVSQAGGKPAYGGSPDDRSVIEAIISLKARGIKVTHNPFVMMDIPAGNTLPNPLWSANSQPAYPWRGRITCFPGIYQQGSVDGTAAATTQINAFFGTASASHFTISGGVVTYSGPQEWSYRRFILHQAALCAAAGGVDAFLIGSEMIGLTRVRAADGSFPAVTALIALAGQVRALLGPSVKITYGADWTEYGAYAPPNSSDLRFPLDPLWASANLDFIGLDWYAPLTDRRVGEPRADLATLKAGIEGGEAYDFYYASDTARQSKTRTPITDGAYLEPWVWRQKDIRGFWTNAHYERIGGIRASTPTPWIAKSKPIALMELGFPAVDKGANRPSVFPDPKSFEAGLPPFSNGARDDLEQIRALEATLSYWQDNNEVATLYNGSMIDLARCHIWAWDTRPFPQFPGLSDLWGDGAYAMLGHWLAGRSMGLTLAALVGDVCQRAKLVEVEIVDLGAYIDGFAIEGPTTGRAVLDNLMTAFGLEVHKSAGGLTITPPKAANPDFQITNRDLIVRDQSPALARSQQTQSDTLGGRFSCYASERDYQQTSFSTPSKGEVVSVNALASPLVLPEDMRKAIANNLSHAEANTSLSGDLSPTASACLEIGDQIGLQDGTVWRIDQLSGDWVKQFRARPVPTPLQLPASYGQIQVPDGPSIVTAPMLLVLDLPAPFTSSVTPKPLIGAAAQTWPGDVEVSIDDKPLGTLTRGVTMGQINAAQPAGPVGRYIHRPLDIEMRFNGTLSPTGRAALIIDATVCDVVSWRSASLIGTNLWRLTGWVRGLAGASEGKPLPVGTQFVVLDDAFQEMAIDQSLVGVTLNWTAKPLADIGQTSTSVARFDASGLSPWPPCQVRARRSSAAINLTWVRRARGTGDAWGYQNAPLEVPIESYELKILSASGQTLRRITTTSPFYVYPQSEEIADFGTTQSTLRVQIAQIGEAGIIGRPAEAMIGL
jgi:hypothetical protein